MGATSLVLIVNQPLKTIKLDQNWETALYFEDDSKLILDKPYGLPSHQTKDPNRLDFTRLVEKALLLPNLRTVNRLDLNTTGLIVLGKTTGSGKVANQDLDEFMQGCEKTYLFLASDLPDFQSRTVRNHIKEEKNKMKSVFSGGKVAITHLTVIALEKKKKLWLGKARIETGRRHQIRLHLADLGHPILGDELYGGKGDKMFLHSAFLSWKKDLEDFQLQSKTPEFWRPILSEWEDESVHGYITSRNKEKAS